MFTFILTIFNSRLTLSLGRLKEFMLHQKRVNLIVSLGVGEKAICFLKGFNLCGFPVIRTGT